MNRAIIVGNLTKDPELRQTQSGKNVATFTVACSRRFAGADGERVTDFLPVVVWGNHAENCNRYLQKGSKVAVCGMIQIRSYEANDGSKRYVTEIVADEVEFLTPKSGSQDMTAIDNDDDVPF